MSVNSHKPHLLVLPEDDANRQIVVGFIQDARINARAIQVLPIAGGWRKVIESFANDHIAALQQYPGRRIVLLIDCDKDASRLDVIRTTCIPSDLQDRVFVLGVWSNPEKLKSHVKGGFEAIGKNLAQDCVDGTNTTWGHALLAHNQTELNRMKDLVNPFLFLT
jgi:hypothetical protein